MKMLSSKKLLCSCAIYPLRTNQQMNQRNGTELS